MGTARTYGFGVMPVCSAHHFFVVLPGLIGNSNVRVYERFHWSSAKNDGKVCRDAEVDPDVTPIYRHGQRIEGPDILRLELPLGKWEKVVKPVTAEFNARLKKAELPSGKFTTGGIPLAEDLGKELMVLLWAIKDADPRLSGNAVENWLGFRPEERRWLYTMTNARHGGLDDRQGWRMALREILSADVGEMAGGHGKEELPCCSSAEVEESFYEPKLNVDLPKPERKSRTCNRKPFGSAEDIGFYLVLPKRGERFFPHVSEGTLDQVVARVPLYQWNEVARDVEDVFNLRLAEDKLPKGKFGMGANALSRLFGKELLVLLWTLEQVSKAYAQTALRNWKTLMPEERWWLYARTAAAPKSWKKALRAALGECGPLAIQGGLF